MSGLRARPGFLDRAGRALADPLTRRAVAAATDRFRTARRAALDALDDPEGLRDRARAIRAATLARLPDLIDRLEERVRAAGGHVVRAATAAEACGYVAGVCRERGARLVVKSKSMVSEEVGLNHALGAEGVRVVETDLGEFIIQLAGEPPSHLVAPAIHKSRRQVADLFGLASDGGAEPDAAALTAWARARLREEFLRADVGLSGVNFAVAESGTIVLVTNEGNGRLVTSLPRVHVALMGLERVVPTWNDLAVLLTLLPRSATGQKMTSYVSFITGPRRAGEADGPEEFHLVIVDNGRSALLGTEYEEVLHCIRCGSCLNVCPVYRQVGGHAYGWVYSGPIGAVLTPLLAGMETWDDLPLASSLCAACTEVCPVKIPLHDLLLRLRSARVRRGLAGAGERLAFRLWAFVAARPAAYRLAVSLAALAQRPLVRDGHLVRGPAPLAAWLRDRDFPALADRSFQQLWASGRLDSAAGSGDADAGGGTR